MRTKPTCAYAAIADAAFSLICSILCSVVHFFHRRGHQGSPLRRKLNPNSLNFLIFEVSSRAQQSVAQLPTSCTDDMSNHACDQSWCFALRSVARFSAMILFRIFVSEPTILRVLSRRAQIANEWKSIQPFFFGTVLHSGSKADGSRLDEDVTQSSFAGKVLVHLKIRELGGSCIFHLRALKLRNERIDFVSGLEQACCGRERIRNSS